MKLSEELVCARPKWFLVEQFCFIDVWKWFKYLLFKKEKEKKKINDTYNYNSMIFCILFFKINALNVTFFCLGVGIEMVQVGD